MSLKTSFELISVQEKKKWMEALHLCELFDTYHLPEYHVLAEQNGEGKPHLFFFQCGSYFAALPILLNNIRDLEGLEKYTYLDATSVYGYPGIITSIKETNEFSDIFRSEFQSALVHNLQKLNIITFFSRLNPLINSSWLFEGLAEVVPIGTTIFIDLKKSENDQIKDMTKGHKYDIRKARREGVSVYMDKSFTHLDAFVKIYNDTMDRVNASKYYYFDHNYFYKFKELLRESAKLFIAYKDNIIISASLFFTSQHIVQYHLSGTPPEYKNLSGSKLIVDEVRKWGKKNGFSLLHLGGGVGSRKDSLFRFKAGFSKNQHQFEIVKLVLNKEAYNKIVDKRNLWVKKHGFGFLDSNYFPIYRTPVIYKG